MNSIIRMPILVLLSTIIVSTAFCQTTSPRTKGMPLQTQLKRVIFPKVDCRDVTVREMVDFIRAKSISLSPQGSGININLTSAAARESDNLRLTLSLQDVPLSELLKYISKATDLKINFAEEGVFFESSQTNLVPTAFSQSNQPPSAVTPLDTKLERIIFPKVDFRDATVREMVDFITRRSKELDPQGTGVNIKFTSDAAKESQNVRLTMFFADIPLNKLLKYSAKEAQLNLIIADELVILDVP